MLIGQSKVRNRFPDFRSGFETVILRFDKIEPALRSNSGSACAPPANDIVQYRGLRLRFHDVGTSYAPSWVHG
jgi:hypothetical protein